MGVPTPQTRANHAKFDPPFHFVLAPALLFLFIWAIVNAVHHPNSEAFILAGLVFVVLLLALKTRVYALKVQDRVIRLEERLRMASLVPAAGQARLGELTESQLIALRFASDAELPALASRALTESLNAKAIKLAIQNWRGDYFRV
jgi:Family of unknown function (DUF6526)